MKMIYLQKSRKTKKNAFLLSLAVVIFVVGGVLVLEIFADRAVGRFSLSLGGPVASVYSVFENRIGFLARSLNTHGALVGENRRLVAELNNIKAKLLRFDSLYKEHQDLLSAYGRTAPSGPRVLGNITAKPPQSPYDVLVVDIGFKDGVSIGGRVYGLGGLPLGRVIEVTGSNAKLVMFSSDGEQTHAVVERTGATIILTGIGGGNMEAEVSPEIDIVDTDKMILPEFNGAIIAQVAEIESGKASASKRVLFSMPINIFSLRFVEVERLSQ